MEFLTTLFENGLSYSAINSARSALSALGIIHDGTVFGSHPIVIKYMKGIYNLRPPLPKYVKTWNVSLVLTELKKLSPVKSLSLKDLTLKLSMLICLIIAGRTQSLHLLSVSGLIKGSKSYILQYCDLLKQTRPGRNNPVVELKAFPPDRRLCCVTVLKEYLKRTKVLRKNTSRLFISYVKPHNPITSSTLSRWLKTVMCKAGIDVNKYSTHSIRVASASKAKISSVPIDNILKSVGWSSERTFARFYDKVIEPNNFQSAVLS